MNNLLVSIVIPSYNYGEYLEAAVDSALQQSYQPSEIIIIDDGSTDNTELIATKLSKKHRQVTYVYQNNSGIVSVRNKALDIASGDFIIQLDADDTLPPEYISEVMKQAEQTGSDIIYTDYKKFGLEESQSDFPEYSFERLKNSNYIHIASLVRLSAVEGVRFDEGLSKKTHEDWDFFIALAVKGCTFSKCNSTHLNYRIHSSARNNLYDSTIDKRQYAQVYMYILDKYKSDNADEFDYLSGYMFANWFEYMVSKADEHTEYIKKLEDDIEKLHTTTRGYMQEIEQLKKTRYSKLKQRIKDLFSNN